MERKSASDRFKERHCGVLHTPELRARFAARIARGLKAAADAMERTAELLIEDPGGMLANAFVPNIIGMRPDALAMFEVVCTNMNDGELMVSIAGKTQMGDSPTSERAFRVLCTSGGRILPRQDNHIGG